MPLVNLLLNFGTGREQRFITRRKFFNNLFKT